MSEDLEQYVGKKVQFDLIPYDSPFYGLSKKELGDIPFSNKSILVGILEKKHRNFKSLCFKV